MATRGNPTKAEEKWMQRIVEFGCICCHVHHNAPETPAVVHHILNASNRRMGHMFTLPLCEPGHHQYTQKNSGKIARHPTKAQFIKAYGTELELLDILKSIIVRADEEELPKSRVHLSLT